MNFIAQKRSKIFLNSGKVVPLNKNQFDDFYYKELASMTGSGGWSINFREKTSSLDPEARKILRLPVDYNPTPKFALSFYAKKHQNKALLLFLKCKKGQPFSTKIKMVRYDKTKFWAKAIGKPILNAENKVIGVQGVFQVITKEVKKQKKLKKAKKTIAFQNERIVDFSKIISHNLKSQAGNLQMTLELLKYTNTDEEIKELHNNLPVISKNLNESLKQLNDLLDIQYKASLPREKVVFSEILTDILKEYQEVISDRSIEVFSDFSEVPSLKYIPSFLKNIFRKLIANSIKYKSEARNLSIDIFSFKENGKKCLLFKDNGMGIDPTEVTTIFNLYSKNNSSDEGYKFNLFILKNQVEALNGSIACSSILGQGTSFKILF